MATVANMYVDIGTDYTLEVELQGDSGQSEDLSEELFRGEARKLYSTTPAFSFSFAKVTGEDGTPSQLQISLARDVTANLEPGKYPYDILMTNEDGSVDKIMEGIVFLLATSTRGAG